MCAWIPFKYNFITGMINRWKQAPDSDDCTVYSMDNEILKQKLEMMASTTFLNSLSFLDRILAQASTKSVPIGLGGPGKIFVVVKHLSSKNLEDLLRI